MTLRLLGHGDDRLLNLDAPDPAVRWADLGRAEDVAAMRGLADAVLGDVHSRRSWSLAWRLATRLAYGVLYRPFGHYVAESDYLAARVAARGVAPADMAALQRLYTLSHAGCSAVMAWDAARGRMVHVRSLDWPSAPAIGRATRRITGRRAGRDVFTAAGLAGMTGMLTAVKPGFSLAINFAPWRGPSFSLNSDPTFLVRHLMESAVSDFAGACRAIAAWRPAAPVFISLCGIDRGEARVFEFGAVWRGARRVNVVDMGGADHLVQTNHYAAASPFARHRRPQAAPRPWDAESWEEHAILETSEARRRLLEEGLAEDWETRDVEALLLRSFARRPVWNRQTAQWVEMIPATGGMRVWARQGGDD